MKKMEQTDFRENVVELLRTIASPEETMKYAEVVRGGDVGGELVCQWFDDLYLLGERHAGAVSAETRERYKSLFDAGELEALERFHAFFSEHVDSLGKHYSAHTLLLDPVWKDIMGQASRALRSFRPPG
jgi:hypothetical protein